MQPFEFHCKYCGHHSTIMDVNYDEKSSALKVDNDNEFAYVLGAKMIKCPNSKCGGVTLSVSLNIGERKRTPNGAVYQKVSAVDSWALLPKSRARVFPMYIPEEIRKNYEEACLILRDSPKASATMSRRALQGMIRDFWDIPDNRRGNLGAEINYIKEKLDASTYDMIRAVREVGDIGAHMEKSVDTIVDVEPEEADLLVSLIESLIEDWYVERYSREQRNQSVRDMVARKREAKKASSSRGANNIKNADEQDDPTHPSSAPK